MKRPQECKNIEEVRNEIDSIDREILNLLGKRFGFVKEVVKYKAPTKDSIIAQERYNFVLDQRKKWAIEEGLDPQVIEQMYKLLIEHFISEELKLIEKENHS